MFKFNRPSRPMQVVSFDLLDKGSIDSYNEFLKDTTMQIVSSKDFSIGAVYPPVDAEGTPIGEVEAAKLMRIIIYKH